MCEPRLNRTEQREQSTVYMHSPRLVPRSTRLSVERCRTSTVITAKTLCLNQRIQGGYEPNMRLCSFKRAMAQWQQVLTEVHGQKLVKVVLLVQNSNELCDSPAMFRYVTPM